MGALRTGAASGVATRHMAREDARVLGLVGTGRQARTQVEAIAKVRALTEVRVFSRSVENRQQFGKDLEARLGISARAVGSGEEAVRGADIVVTSTTSTEPVVQGAWLAPGTHVNAIGANYEYRRELDYEAVARASVIATDDTDQVRYEATDLAAPVREGLLSWDTVLPLGSIVAGAAKGRTDAQDITLFKSLGVAIEDVALAIRAYEKALGQGVGQKLPNLSG